MQNKMGPPRQSMAQKANGNASRYSGFDASIHSNASTQGNGAAHPNTPHVGVAINGNHASANGGVNGNGTVSALKPRASAPTRGANAAGPRELPLRGHTERALQEYFASLNGHRPARLYDMVLHEVEEPLFRAVLDYAAGNQSRAAGILGINRGTLRKKLRALGLSE